MDIKQMVESITREILHTMQICKPQKPKVLYIFCDSTAHEAFIEQFIQLQNAGIDHDILFLDGETSSWLGMHKLECGGAGKLITVDEYAPAPIELPKEYAGIVIPEIDLDNAARIVSGMKGTIKAEIVFAALVLNKFVLVGSDVPGIKRSDRRTLKTLDLPASYRNLFVRYQKQLEDLGVGLTEQKYLALHVIEKVREHVPETASESPDKGTFPQQATQFDGKLLSVEWLQKWGQTKRTFLNNRLILSPQTIITPLAQDWLREKGIKVKMAGAGD
ncbi:hypothetical protein [Brevibacillus sp. SYSU BS000544]|uniref:hypothetical protein n=1 Tax=Brevibacillus sp. SYSU BS000544 TaxID=3416443 RepID=UPI003CE5192B